jgi:two-component system cell cycle sensor histidine kinase/response regulator CckA
MRFSNLSHDSGTSTVLVVDDEPVLRAVLTRLLRSEGYAVMEASDGTSALDIFERHTGIIPLVLMDIQMPGPDGVRVAMDLKSKNPDVSVIYMSGQIDPRTLDLGPGEWFLRKPFGFAQLTTLVGQHLASAR